MRAGGRGGGARLARRVVLKLLPVARRARRAHGAGPSRRRVEHAHAHAGQARLTPSSRVDGDLAPLEVALALLLGPLLLLLLLLLLSLPLLAPLGIVAQGARRARRARRLELVRMRARAAPVGGRWDLFVFRGGLRRSSGGATSRPPELLKMPCGASVGAAWALGATGGVASTRVGGAFHKAAARAAAPAAAHQPLAADTRDAAAAAQQHRRACVRVENNKNAPGHRSVVQPVGHWAFLRHGNATGLALRCGGLRLER